MKIVTYDEFVRMPAGTIFAPYKPCVFEDRMEIKVDGGGEYIDWQGKKKWGFIGTMPLEPWLGDMAPMDYGEYEAKWEIYDGDQNDASFYSMFAVLEPQDVDKLISILRWAQGGCKGEVPEGGGKI